MGGSFTSAKPPCLPPPHPSTLWQFFLQFKEMFKAPGIRKGYVLLGRWGGEGLLCSLHSTPPLAFTLLRDDVPLVHGTAGQGIAPEIRGRALCRKHPTSSVPVQPAGETESAPDPWTSHAEKPVVGCSEPLPSAGSCSFPHPATVTLCGDHSIDWGQQVSKQRLGFGVELGLSVCSCKH